MEIGDRIRVLACVETSYVSPEDMHRYYQLRHTPDKKSSNGIKYLYRWPFGQLWSGIFIGWTYLATGAYDVGDSGNRASESYPVPPFLQEDVRHKVGVVVLINKPGKSQQYVQPIHCLPEDIYED